MLQKVATGKLEELEAELELLTRLINETQKPSDSSMTSFRVSEKSMMRDSTHSIITELKKVVTDGRLKELKPEFRPMIECMKDELGDRVEKTEFESFTKLVKEKLGVTVDQVVANEY